MTHKNMRFYKKSTMTYSQDNTISFTKRSAYFLITVFLSFFLISTYGCSKNDPNNAKSTHNDLKGYYPFTPNGYWSYKWSSLRGDAWRASFVVTNTRQVKDTLYYMVTDSSQQDGRWVVYQSAYVWDNDGLKHLYRSSATGDCTVYSPPRIVLHSKVTVQLAGIENSKSHRSNYKYHIYSSQGALKYSTDVTQEQRLINSDAQVIDGKTYNDCIAIETILTDTYPDGKRLTKRRVIWYANEIGPVKIITGISPNSPQIKGEETGFLATYKRGL